jgi:hypothetical protein
MTGELNRADKPVEAEDVEFPLYVEDVDDTNRYRYSTLYRILADGGVVAITRQEHKRSRRMPDFTFHIEAMEANDLSDYLEMDRATAPEFFARLQELRDLMDHTLRSADPG